MNSRFFTLLWLLIASLGCFGQELSSIEGMVVDADTNEALPYASLYLAHTTIGVASRLDGTFKLENIPPGKYDFIVSMLGYSTVSIPMVLDGKHSHDFQVKLKSTTKQLETITINGSKIETRKIDFAEFKKYFLGETQNALHCQIINIKDIFVYKQDGKLIALATKPIVIVNQALGYKTFYELKEFEVNYLRGQIITSGIPRFEELVPASDHQRKKWLRERDRAYYGSFGHFLRSLLHQELAKNYFQVKDKDGMPVSEQQLINENIINYKGLLNVTYSNEYPEVQNKRYLLRVQNSTIEFSGKPITVYENGNFDEFHSLILDGYFGWTSRVAELLPYGYQPSKSINSK